MTRLLGPDESSRRVDTIVQRIFRSKANRPAQLWADEAATIPADMQWPDGTPIPGSTVMIDSSSNLPDMLWPDGVNTIYGTCDGGAAWKIRAHVDGRIDDLTARTVAAEAVMGIESIPVTAGLSWSGAVDLTTLAATTRTIHATLTGPVTLTLPTPAAGKSHTVTLLLTQDATGGRTLTLPGVVLSAYGVDPVLSTAGGARDLLHLMWTGTEWIALMGAPGVA